MRKACFANPFVAACCYAILFALVAKPQSPPDAAPSEAEQQRILDAMRQYAGQYIAKLPNFICQQNTMQYEAGKNGKHWHKGDTLTSKLVFANGREERTLQMVNNKQPRPGMRPRARIPLSTEGEFGILVSKIFDDDSQAKFTWSGWDTVRGHRVAKFDYAIDRQHSTLSLTNYIKATVPYHGSVAADPNTGAVWRVTSGSDEIPEELQIKSIATEIEYDQVRIGNQDYLLPVSATVLLVSPQDQVRNEMQFEGYRKFEAESTITFGGNDTKKPQQP